jgi:hypothetical protein
VSWSILNEDNKKSIKRVDGEHLLEMVTRKTKDEMEA